MVVGVNQLVAVDAGGYTYINESGGAPRSSWVSSNPNAPLCRTSLRGDSNIMTYGNNRYVAITNGYVFVSK